jgi:hypothetical protein
MAGFMGWQFAIGHGGIGIGIVARDNAGRAIAPSVPGGGVGHP